jgi:hypothetical protein
MQTGFGDFYGQTSLHPLALAVVIILTILVFTLSARRAFAPLIIAATTLPMAQRLVIAGADFTLMRILLLAYMLRILTRKENQDFRWNRLDTAVLLWTISGTLIFTIHFGTSGAFINRIGWSFDILVTYFAVRCLVRQIDDVVGIARVLAIVSLPIAAFFVIEMITHRNLFAIFGGMPFETAMREGKFRCQGAFSHPILAGTFWASSLPMIWMLWKREGSHQWAIIGTLSVLLIVFACASSTPVLTVMVALLGLALFRYREKRKVIWVTLVTTLTVLHLFIMQKPIWHLMSRVDLIGGSTGRHRYLIFDAFVKYFDRWYLTGESNAQSWGVWQMRDITNQFILEGLRGGLLTLSFFILALLFSFGNVGRTLRGIQPLNDTASEKVVWLVGVTIMVHTFTFFGVSYFGQMTALLYIHMALAGAVAAQMLPNLLAARSPAPEPAPPGARTRRASRPT